MPVPKKRQSSARRDKRRAHDFRTPSYGIVCSNCGAQVVPHRVCGACGFYRGRQVIIVNQD